MIEPVQADAPDDQRAWCEHRIACLELAAARGWRSFACAGCGSYRPLAGQARDTELAVLAHVGRSLVRRGPL